MVLLIPASIVMVATALRAALSASRRSAGEAAPEPDGVLLPFLWIYALAPLAGGAGALLPFRGNNASTSLHAALVPLVAGVGLSLISGALFFLFSSLDRRRSARAGGRPARSSTAMLILPGCSALIVALAVCLYYGKISPAIAGQAARSSPVLSMQWDTGRGAGGFPAALGNSAIPELQVLTEGYTLDGHALATDDALFRLTGLAARSASIVLKPAAGVSAARLAEGLALVNQAGFAQVGVDAGSAAASISAP